MSSLLLGLLRSPASSRRRAKEKSLAADVEKHNEGVELKPLSLTPRTAYADEPTSPKELGLGPLPQVKSAPEVAEPLEVAAAPTRSPPPVAEPLPVQPQPPASHWPESAESQFVLRYLSPSHDASVDISPLIRTGFLLCKLLSAAIPGSLDERAINTGSGSSAANSPRSGVGAAGGGGGRAAGAAAEIVIGVGGGAGGADGAAQPGAAWAGVVAAACRPGALGGLTAEEAEENCQLCRSCATVQGCDVAGIAPEALQAGEAGAVTEFVLEVLRQSAVQALPPGQRQWLVPPPQPAPTALVTAGPRARARAGGAAAGAGALAVLSATSSARAEAHLAATTAPGPGPAQAALYAAPCGTTAARRAVAGLQHWAASRLAGAPGGSADEAQEQGQVHAVGAGAAVDGTTLFATPAAWSRLANCVVSAQEAMQAPVLGPGPEGSGLVAAEQPGAAVGKAVDFDDGGCAEHEWEAAAPALDRALRAALPAPPGGACAPAMPSLRPEYLRSPHAGLRSALLAHVLLASVSAAASAAASTAVASATEGQARCGVEGQDAEGASGRHNGSEQAPVQQEARGDLVSGPLSCHLTLGEGGFDGAASADSGAVSPSTAAMSASATATAAAVMQPPPASPAPPLPADARQRQTSGGGGAAAGGWGGHPHLRGVRSLGPHVLGPPADMLSEHNKLVAWEHQQRQLRRQQRSMGSRGAGDGGPVGEGAAGDGFGGGGGGGGGLAKAGSRSASRSELWGGEAEDLEGDSQEERVLRLWLNSLDPARLHVGSLFDREVATGWPLLLALDAIQPGCVAWTDTFRPPFKEKLHKILSVQNCNQVVALCGGRLGLPHLVNIGGLDLALGQRRATLSLVFQMMHHHTGMVLGLLAPSPTPTTTSASPTPRSPSAAAASSPASALPQPAHAPSGQPRGTGGVGSSSGGGSSAASPRHTHPQHPQQQQLQHQLQHHFQLGQQGQQGQWHAHPRQHVEVEKAVIGWANAKLMAAAGAAAAANGSSAAEGKAEDEASNAVASAAVSVAPTMPFTPLSGFSDPRLAEGQVLLQLLAAISPRAVSAKYVLPGHDAGERESNAKYLLSCARKIGCVIFLGWEDVLSARPRLLLLLLASVMAHDRKREAAAGFIQ